jgi:hypothetical protein
VPKVRKLCLATIGFLLIGGLITWGVMEDKDIPEAWEGQTITIEGQEFIIEDGSRLDGSWMLVVTER